mmetsp:Transcript_11596/g.46893  ORF Transcript_11596/g.46893 Transcript_11596/m.46893 type:complete len:205 (+) Transcript_11596:2182-2796(+)
MCFDELRGFERVRRGIRAQRAQDEPAFQGSAFSDGVLPSARRRLHDLLDREPFERVEGRAEADLEVPHAFFVVETRRERTDTFADLGFRLEPAVHPVEDGPVLLGLDPRDDARVGRRLRAHRPLHLVDELAERRWRRRDLLAVLRQNAAFLGLVRDELGEERAVEVAVEIRLGKAARDGQRVGERGGSSICRPGRTHRSSGWRT